MIQLSDFDQVLLAWFVPREIMIDFTGILFLVFISSSNFYIVRCCVVH